MKIFLEPLVIVVTIAASVAAAPSRKIMGPLDESNMAYPLGSYNDPFDPPSQLPQEEIMKLRRNLDHIGGGNLLRSLDRIGGGNLLRDVEEPKKSDSSRLPNGAKVNDENSGIPTGARTFIVDPKDVQSWYEDHPGGDLLGDSQFEKNQRYPWIQSFRAVNDRLYSTGSEFLPYYNEADQKNKHRQGYPQRNANSPQSHTQPIEKRNLDHIGGGHLLRDLANPEDYRILGVEDQNFF